MKNTAITRARCEDCGFRIRGKNHESGNHHKTASRDGQPKRQFNPGRRR